MQKRSQALILINTNHFKNVKCKISFHVYKGKEDKDLKWRDLTGPEKIRLHEKINLESCFLTRQNYNDTNYI